MRTLCRLLAVALVLGQAVPAPVWRLAWLAPAAVLFTPQKAEAAITSRVGWTLNSGTTCTMAASLTSGTVLVLGFLQYGAHATQAISTVTTNGSLTGWAQVTGAGLTSAGNRRVEVWRDLLNTESGSVNVVVTAVNTTSYYCELIELPDTYDMEDAADCFEDTDTSGSPSQNHNADTGGIDTAANAFLYYASVLNSSTGGTATQPSSPTAWTDAGAEPTTQIGSGYLESASTITGTRATWTNTGTGRTNVGCVVSLKNAATSAVRSPLLRVF